MVQGPKVKPDRNPQIYNRNGSPNYISKSAKNKIISLDQLLDLQRLDNGLQPSNHNHFVFPSPLYYFFINSGISGRGFLPILSTLLKPRLS